ncbi:MAG: PAS domain S-box protein [Thiogranum sp.]|nr:PAS domain S-box protein [Thiogranum sp.]
MRYDFLDSTGIAIVVLDTALCLRHFTPAAATAFGLRDSGLGHPVSDLHDFFKDASMVTAARAALETLAADEAGICMADARCFLRRIAPLGDSAKKPAGVIISFVELTRCLQIDAGLRYLAAILMHSTDAITVQDTNGNIIEWNRGAEQMYGYTRAEALRMNAQDLVPPGDREHNRSLLARTLGGEMVDPFETRRITRHGRVLDVWLTATRLSGDSGETVALATTERDISARKQIEHDLINLNTELELRVAERTAEAERKALELQEREERLSAIVATAPDAIITITRDGFIDSFNPAAESMFGYAADEALGGKFGMLMPPPHSGEQEDCIAHYLAKPGCKGGGPQEIRGRRKDGSIFPMELNVTQIDHRGLFIGIARDMSEKRALEKQIIEVSTQEQERIGHEIHDGLGQQLSALTMMATSLERKFADRALPEAEPLRALVTHLQSASEEAHALSLGLAPVPIDPKGLEAALEKLTDHVQSAAGIACHLTVSHPVTVEDRTLAMQLYRIAQEAVNNAVKHARANNISIDLTTGKEGFILTVSDDGKGMATDSRNSEGLGMHIMRYRANIIGATLRVKSAVGEGTTLSCMLAQPPTDNPG